MHHTNTFDRNKASDKVHIVSTSSGSSPTGSSTNSYPNQTHHNRSNREFHVLNSSNLKQRSLIQQSAKISSANITRTATANYNPNSTNSSSATTSLDANSNSNNPSEGYHSNQNGNVNATVAVTNQLWQGGMPQTAINSHMIETPMDLRKPMVMSTFRGETDESEDEEGNPQPETQQFINTNDHYNPPSNQNVQIQGLEPQNTFQVSPKYNNSNANFQTYQNYQHSPSNYQQTSNYNSTNYQQNNSTSTFQPLPPPTQEMLNDNFESTFTDSNQNSPNNHLNVPNTNQNIPYNRYNNENIHQAPPTLTKNQPVSQQSQFSPRPAAGNVGNLSKLSNSQQKINHVKTSSKKSNSNQCCNIIFTAIASL